MGVDAPGAVEVSVSVDSLHNLRQGLGLEKQTRHGATKVVQADLWVSSTSTDSSKPIRLDQREVACRTYRGPLRHFQVGPCFVNRGNGSLS